MSALDQALPRYDVRERHVVRLVAPPAAALAAVRAVTPAEVPLARALLWLRGLPASASAPLFDQLLATGFVVLADGDREVVLGAIGRPWQLRSRLHRTAKVASAVSDAVSDTWARFDEPGYAKIAVEFRADGATISTETRVLATDARSRRRFLAYWFAIRPFSGLIRRLWLRAAKRQLERL